MKKRCPWKVIVAVSVVAVTLGAVFYASLPVKDEQYVWISGCQAYRYKSIEELAQNSDIIAIVKVKGLKERSAC